MVFWKCYLFGEIMNGLDLFSGIGGLSVALKGYIKTICYCESDRYAQSVLLSRMQSGDLDIAPIWDNVCTLNATMFSTKPEIIFGGFPCQDISVANNGTGKGLDGKRSRLFYEIVRLAKELQPTFVFLENVPAIRTKGLEQVIEAFASLGYDCRWTCISASSVGALHKRDRWFFLAYTYKQSVWEQPRGFNGQDRQETNESCNDGKEEPVAHANSLWELPKQWKHEGIIDGSWWDIEPDVGRVAHGVPNRLDRIKCLGNAVVPRQAKIAFEKLIGFNL